MVRSSDIYCIGIFLSIHGYIVYGKLKCIKFAHRLTVIVIFVWIFKIWHLHDRYEDAFNRFVDEVNGLAAYQWWEGSIYSILSVLAYPLAWSWLQQCRKRKLQLLRDFVRSEYDHACLRSCRSRALYEGLKVCLLMHSECNFEYSFSSLLGRTPVLQYTSLFW